MIKRTHSVTSVCLQWFSEGRKLCHSCANKQSVVLELCFSGAVRQSLSVVCMLCLSSASNQSFFWAVHVAGLERCIGKE